MPVRRLFLVCLLLLGAFPAVFPSGAQKKSDGSVREKFVGAWRLLTLETVRPNGEVIYPFYGKHPAGLIVYDRHGWMSVQIVSDPPSGVPKDSSWEGFLAAPSAEKVAAVESYYAYFGTWTVDPVELDGHAPHPAVVAAGGTRRRGSSAVCFGWRSPDLDGKSARDGRRPRAQARLATGSVGSTLTLGTTLGRIELIL